MTENMTTVEQILERKSHPVIRDASVAPTDDMHERLLELEAKGEIILQRMKGDYVEFPTKYGRMKKIPIEHTWHHKSCGHCGHIPGYASSILWLHRQFNLDYHDPTDQTSCTGWNYYASAASNAVGQAAVMSRNFAAAYETGYFPMIHCGTSFGHYKEIREQLVHHKDLRDEVRRILDKMGKPLVIPEEIVHYSEWVYAMRERFAERQLVDMSAITATVHPACHYYKIVAEDAIYDPEIYGGQRTAVVTALLEKLGVNVADYSTWFDCCGFGFRHVLVQRDFTRSYAVLRKIETMINEANPDLTVTHWTRVSSPPKRMIAKWACLFYLTRKLRHWRWEHIHSVWCNSTGTPQIGVRFWRSLESIGRNIGMNFKAISIRFALVRNLVSPGKMQINRFT